LNEALHFPLHRPQEADKIQFNSMTVVLPPISKRRAAQFSNAAEWLSALGDVPLARIMMDPAPGTATEADLLRFVERDKRLCELVDGTLVEKPLGSWEGLVAARVVTFLTIFADAHKLGAVCGDGSPMRMKSKRVRLPDVSFISLARLPTSGDPVFNLSPDLAVEVLSESNTKKEIQLKLREYFKSGTRLAWIIDPSARTTAIYHDAKRVASLVGEDGVLKGEPVLPGLRLAMADLFVNVPRY
jgi:Uma2 family endonuclease